MLCTSYLEFTILFCSRLNRSNPILLMRPRSLVHFLFTLWLLQACIACVTFMFCFLSHLADILNQFFQALHLCITLESLMRERPFLFWEPAFRQLPWHPRRLLSYAYHKLYFLALGGLSLNAASNIFHYQPRHNSPISFQTSLVASKYEFFVSPRDMTASKRFPHVVLEYAN